MTGRFSTSRAGRASLRAALPAALAALAIGTAIGTAACGSGAGTPPAAQSGSGAATPAAAAKPSPEADAAFTTLTDQLFEDMFRRNPTLATYLGIHAYDDQLEDASRAAIDAESAAIKGFRARVAAIDPATLSLPNQLDREQVLHALDSKTLTLDVVRPWAKNPDVYASGITQTAFIMIKRSFASPEERLKKLIARERLMLRTLEEARKNLDNPPEILTKIAIEQVDGNRGFFVSAVPAAFTGVKDQALLDEFAAANKAVIDALAAYKTFLQKDLLPRSKGDFAIGRDTLVKKLAADEMVTLPLDRLLAIAQADLARNKKALEETAATIAPGKPVMAVMDAVTVDHPPAAKLLGTTQAMLDSIRQFIQAKGIVTLPAHAPAKVEETPPFLRATTSASMDIPGPFETVATEAFYNMTLPDPAWPKAQIDSFMRQWYFASIANVSVHETYPGHYVQFLYASQFPSKTRKVLGAASNSEGWAHYCEQMMLEEGIAPALKQDELKYRLAQLQDALLRDVRFIVGIRLHSEGLTVEAAQKLFETEAYQPKEVALSEAKRGTTDPTYGYYTMGKLMILKLREDYKAQKGAAYNLREFHDTFLKLGPLPLPLMRRAMLGEAAATADPFPAAGATN